MVTSTSTPGSMLIEVICGQEIGGRLSIQKQKSKMGFFFGDFRAFIQLVIGTIEPTGLTSTLATESTAAAAAAAAAWQMATWHMPVAAQTPVWHSLANLHSSHLLDDVGGGVQVDKALVQLHLEAVKGVGTVTCRGGDAQGGTARWMGEWVAEVCRRK